MLQIRENVSLKQYSNFKIGGNARFFIEVTSQAELEESLTLWREMSSSFPLEKKQVFLLSKGTNILFRDEGFDGLVLHLDVRGLERQGNHLIASSGVLISEVTDFCIEQSLSGMEWAGGLPGTVGAAVRGNAGAFGGEIKDVVVLVESIDMNTLQVTKRDKKACRFSYRSSIFKLEEEGSEIITRVSFSLSKGEKLEIEKKTEEKVTYRKNRHPLEYPNIGSIFKNVAYESLSEKLKETFKNEVKNDPFPVVPVAKILLTLGLAGKRIGGAEISRKHPNYIVNVNNALASDVKALIALIKQRVKSAYGIILEEEVICL